MNLLEHWNSRLPTLVALVKEADAIACTTKPSTWLQANVQHLVAQAHQELVQRRFDTNVLVSPSDPRGGYLCLHIRGWGFYHRQTGYGYYNRNRAFSPETMTLTVFRKRKRALHRYLQSVDTMSSAKARAVFETVSKALSQYYWPALRKINHLTDRGRDRVQIGRKASARWQTVGRWSTPGRGGSSTQHVRTLDIADGGFKLACGDRLYDLRDKPYELVVLDAFHKQARELVDRVRTQRELALVVARDAWKKIQHEFTWVTMAKEL